MLPRVLAHFVNLDNARVIEFRGSFALGVETLDLIHTRKLAGQDHL